MKTFWSSAPIGKAPLQESESLTLPHYHHPHHPQRQSDDRQPVLPEHSEADFQHQLPLRASTHPLHVHAPDSAARERLQTARHALVLTRFKLPKSERGMYVCSLLISVSVLFVRCISQDKHLDVYTGHPVKTHDRPGIRLRGKRKQWECLIIHFTSPNSRRVLNGDTGSAWGPQGAQVRDRFSTILSQTKPIAGGHYSVPHQPNNEQ